MDKSMNKELEFRRLNKRSEKVINPINPIDSIPSTIRQRKLPKNISSILRNDHNIFSVDKELKTDVENALEKSHTTENNLTEKQDKIDLQATRSVYCLGDGTETEDRIDLRIVCRFNGDERNVGFDYQDCQITDEPTKKHCPCSSKVLCCQSFVQIPRFVIKSSLGRSDERKVFVRASDELMKRDASLGEEVRLCPQLDRNLDKQNQEEHTLPSPFLSSTKDYTGCCDNDQKRTPAGRRYVSLATCETSERKVLGKDKKRLSEISSNEKLDEERELEISRNDKIGDKSQKKGKPCLHCGCTRHAPTAQVKGNKHMAGKEFQAFLEHYRFSHSEIRARIFRMIMDRL